MDVEGTRGMRMADTRRQGAPRTQNPVKNNSAEEKRRPCPATNLFVFLLCRDRLFDRSFIFYCCLKGVNNAVCVKGGRKACNETGNIWGRESQQQKKTEDARRFEISLSSACIIKQYPARAMRSKTLSVRAGETVG